MGGEIDPNREIFVSFFFESEIGYVFGQNWIARQRERPGLGVGLGMCSEINR